MPPAVNKQAYGNAWLVDGFVKASNPDEEIGLIATTDLKTTAIVTDPVTVPGPSEGRDTIFMTSYTPNELHYHYTSGTDRTAVFSEIYYPDWKATVDGKDIGLFRADWVLRAATLPAGEHDLVMRFEPKVYSWSEKTSRASSAILLILLVAAVAGAVAGKKKEKE